jgi:lysophospholipase L1-like esterase
MRITFLYTTLLITAAIRADEPSGTPLIGKLPAARVLFLGNSITLHGPAANIGWSGNWGMAASTQQKDYVHLLTADLAKATGSKPKTMVKNIADFERGYESFDIATQLKAELDFNAHLVIVAIGENTNEPKTDEEKAKFAVAFGSLLKEFKQHGSPQIFVRSSFWPNHTKDEIMQQAAQVANAVFVDLAALGLDKSHQASAERDIKHAGVAGHPGDKGMRAIADAIFSAISKQASVVANQ